jgi:plastocyanin
MRGMLLFFLLLTGSTSFAAAQASQEPFVGCLNRLPGGTLQFGAVPSGELFLVRGQTNVLEEHVNQLVRIVAESARSGGDDVALPTLTVSGVQTLAKSCTSALPAKRFEEIPGKVGEDVVAVPLTTTSTEDRTTPGFQTQDATAELSGSQSVSSGRTVERPGAPPHPEQVAESEAAANVIARGVERTEILPGSTLGVNGSTGPVEVVRPGTQPATPPSAKSVSPNVISAPVIVTISGNAQPKLSPPRVSIRTGQTVEWINSSATMEEIIANPARETQPSNATLPTGAKPFDSGFLRPDHNFQHRFNAPGVYRYFCKLNNWNNSMRVVGEVVVER